MTRYDYKKPRNINWVSLLVLLIIAGGIYAGWKFVPVYLQAQKVDQALDEVKLDVANISSWTTQQRFAVEGKIRAKAIAAIHDLGIDDDLTQPVEVWFSGDYQYIQARYLVIVQHPFHKTTRMTMNRKVKIPTTKHL